MTFLFKTRAARTANHTHIRMFSGDPSLDVWALNGHLTMRNEEWAEFKEKLTNDGGEWVGGIIIEEEEL